MAGDKSIVYEPVNMHINLGSDPKTIQEVSWKGQVVLIEVMFLGTWDDGRKLLPSP